MTTKEQRNDEIIAAVSTMIDGWDLKELYSYASDSIIDYYLGNTIDESEIEQLLEDYGDHLCSACCRPELECSQNPCEAAQLDRLA